MFLASSHFIHVGTAIKHSFYSQPIYYLWNWKGKVRNLRYIGSMRKAKILHQYIGYSVRRRVFEYPIATWFCITICEHFVLIFSIISNKSYGENLSMKAAVKLYAITINKQFCNFMFCRFILFEPYANMSLHLFTSLIFYFIKLWFDQVPLLWDDWNRASMLPTILA